MFGKQQYQIVWTHNENDNTDLPKQGNKIKIKVKRSTGRYRRAEERFGKQRNIMGRSCREVNVRRYTDRWKLPSQT